MYDSEPNLLAQAESDEVLLNSEAFLKEYTLDYLKNKRILNLIVLLVFCVLLEKITAFPCVS